MTLDDITSINPKFYDNYTKNMQNLVQYLDFMRLLKYASESGNNEYYQTTKLLILSYNHAMHRSLKQIFDMIDDGAPSKEVIKMAIDLGNEQIRLYSRENF